MAGSGCNINARRSGQIRPSAKKHDSQMNVSFFPENFLIPLIFVFEMFFFPLKKKHSNFPPPKKKREKNRLDFEKNTHEGSYPSSLTHIRHVTCFIFIFCVGWPLCVWYFIDDAGMDDSYILKSWLCCNKDLIFETSGRFFLGLSDFLTSFKLRGKEKHTHQQFEYRPPKGHHYFFPLHDW